MLYNTGQPRYQVPTISQMEVRQNSMWRFTCQAMARELRHTSHSGHGSGITRIAIMKKQQGFTLIEIAIVLVIIGLLLGGILKGQELINSARVRNIASQLEGIKIAYLAFQDRYRALPGDMPTVTAASSLPQVNGAAAPGCGVSGTGNCGNGVMNPSENLLVWSQLAASGFITGTYNGTVAAGDTGAFLAPAPTTNPVNAFSGYVELVNDADYLDLTAATNHTNIKTGGNVPVG